jgi:hypothetical protein
MVDYPSVLKLVVERTEPSPTNSSPVQKEAPWGCRLRLSCVLGMLSSLEVKVLRPT